MSDVRTTVNKVVDSMIRDNGYEYTAGFLNTFLIRVIEESVQSESEKQMILIRILSDGILNQLDHINHKIAR